MATGAPCATAPDWIVAKSPYTVAEVEQMLRNFRLRRRLGFLPGSFAGGDSDGVDGRGRALRGSGCGDGASLLVPGDPLDLRWVRQAWRPRCLPSEEPVVDRPGAAEDYLDEGSSPAAQKDPAADVAELHRRVEEGYSRLNAERRSKGALEDGLRRQSESVEAISKESANLQAQLKFIQQEIQENIVENGKLSTQLGVRRQSQARDLSQVGVLASAISHLGKPEARVGAEEELAACRVLIKALVEENEALQRALEAPLAASSPSRALLETPSANGSAGLSLNSGREGLSVVTPGTLAAAASVQASLAATTLESADGMATRIAGGGKL